MPAPRGIAGFVADAHRRSRTELPARRGPPLVNGAGDAFADAADEGGAARRLVVGAAQTAQPSADGFGQALGHETTVAGPILAVEVDAKAGTAGAAALAGVRLHHGPQVRTTVTLQSACATTCELTLPR